MANIEMHGVHIIGESGTLQILMTDKFRKAGLADEVVITEISSSPYNCNEQVSLVPFFRIWGETKEEIAKVVEILRELEITKKFDIETVILNSFIPKE